MSGHHSNRADNHILRALPREEYQRVIARLQFVPLEFKQVLSESRVPIAQVYFPTSAVLSWRRLLEDGSGVEVATIGNEGMTGFCTLLGADSAPANVIVQVPGDALRMTAAELIATCKSNRTFSRLLHRYFNAFLIQVIQSVACNTMNPLESHFPLAINDHHRIQVDQVPLTHEVLANVGRPPRQRHRGSATAKSGAYSPRSWQDYGARSHRPESAACECYHTVKKEFDRSWGGERRAARDATRDWIDPRPSFSRWHNISGVAPWCEPRLVDSAAANRRRRERFAAELILGNRFERIGASFVDEGLACTLVAKRGLRRAWRAWKRRRGGPSRSLCRCRTSHMAMPPSWMV